MSNAKAKPLPAYVAFIDEAGDPGIRHVEPGAAGSATEWFMLSAVLVRVEDEPLVVDWVRSIREAQELAQGPAIHYRNLTPTKKRNVAAMVAKLPIRSFLFASHKVNMSGYKNPRAEKTRSNEHFYNWCTRLLLERVTHFVHKNSVEKFGEARPVRLVFSKRGGLSYGQLKAYHEYIRTQSSVNKLHIIAGDMTWDSLDREEYISVPHKHSAGCQLADIVVSAFYEAANPGAKHWSNGAAKCLRPIIAKRGRAIGTYGVTVFPPEPEPPKLTSEQAAIFNFYGYDL